MVLLDTTTHVAGVIAKVGCRYLQRCCICGEKLADNRDPALQMFWEEGELVRTKDGHLRSVGCEMLSIKKFPRDFCLALVER